jgi:putative oxidoreductase
MFHYEKIDAFRAKHNDCAYLLFRLFVGLLFMFHGAQKVFGLFTDNPAQSLFSDGGWSVAGVNLMYFAGLIEFFGGVLIAIGLITSVASLLSLIVMIVAFFGSHFSVANPLPILNRGELAFIYLVCFLYIAFEGGGKYSVDAKMCKDCKPKR